VGGAGNRIRTCDAIDVVVHPWVTTRCTSDPTFRKQLIALATHWVEQERGLVVEQVGCGAPSAHYHRAPPPPRSRQQHTHPFPCAQTHPCSFSGTSVVLCLHPQGSCVPDPDTTYRGGTVLPSGEVICVPYIIEEEELKKAKAGGDAAPQTSGVPRLPGGGGGGGGAPPPPLCYRWRRRRGTEWTCAYWGWW
jgi:hypothetical protein